MGQVINIHSTEQEINLEIGKHKVDVLGGWGVDLGQFSISFIHSVTGQKVNCKKTIWPIQSFAFDKRANRIFIANILESGIYRIEFRQPETLKVKEANLFFSGLFQKPISNDKISIYIH